MDSGRHAHDHDATVNGLTLLLLLAMAVGIAVAWRAGVLQGQRAAARAARLAPAASEAARNDQLREAASPPAHDDALRSALADAEAMHYQATAFTEDRYRLHREVAAARAETARYRDLCIDLENNAAPPLLDGPNAPDDLKLIVGIGPVLERMLHQLGVSTYRQIARWSERDIDEFDARLPEFPGRIRRDAWVTQARELHQSKFGETLPVRER
jgi:predicted flap endonuclease-1-like 5' DNA nuclease